MAVHYRNFNLELDWSKDAATGVERVTLTHPGIPPQTVDFEGTQDFIFPLIASPQSFETDDFHRKAGTVLAGIFFPADQPLGRAFRRTLKRFRRVRLRLTYPSSDVDPEGTKATALLNIPWEYLYIDDPDAKLNEFLCCKPGFSLVHCLPTAQAGRSTTSGVKDLPIRLAFLYSTSTGDSFEEAEDIFADTDRDLKERDRDQIVRWEVILRADEVDINTKLRHSDLVQIFSHGKEDAIGVVGGVATAQELRSLQDFVQNDEHQLKAVVLCACKSALDPLGVAATLHKIGVPVVIGITRRINVDTARLFMKALYAELAEGVYNLEQALAFVRLQLRQSNWSDENKLSLEWGLPRLYLSSRSSIIVPDRHLFSPLHDLLQGFADMISKRLEKLQSQRITPSDKVQDQIQEWINGREEILYISGPSGSGKSTEIARLLAQNREFVRHICAEMGKGKDITNDPLAFSQDSLFPQLEAFYGERRFHECLGRGVYPVTARDPRQAFLDLVVDPLRKARAQTGRQPIIVVDGLDNAVESSSGYSILDLLLDYGARLIQGARLIITADSDRKETHGRILKELRLKPDNHIPMEPVNEAQLWADLEENDRFRAFLSATSLHLPDWLQHPPTHEQVQRFAERVGAEKLLAETEGRLSEIKGMLAETEYERILSLEVRPALLQVAKRVGSGSLFSEETGLPAWQQRPIPHQTRQFVKRVIEDLATLDSVKAAESLFNDLLSRMDQLAGSYDRQNNPSANLRNYYRVYLDFALEWNKGQAEYIKSLLEALSVAYHPLPVDMIARLINLPHDQQVSDLVNRVSSFIESLEQGLICEHPSIRRFLADVLPADEAHGLFVEMSRKKVGGDEWGKVTNWSRLYDDAYAQRYLVTHAYERYRKTGWKDPNRRQRADDFLALVTAPSFRAFRLDTAGLGAALEDVRYALQVALVETMLPHSTQSLQALDTVEHLLTAYSSYKNPSIIDLERELRLENGGVPALLEFLGLFMGIPAM
jgi:hypothetical protein